MSSKEIIKQLTSLGGIDIEKEIVVKDERVYDRVFRDESLGFGESYMLGWWECDHLDQLICKIFNAGIKEELVKLSLYSKIKLGLAWLYNYMFPVKTVDESKIVAVQHYDLGNDLYENMLEPMVYSCGYFRSENDTLRDSQINKMELIKRKLGLKAGMKVLDIGCGWGELAGYLGGCGIVVDGITISVEQRNYANEKFGDDHIKFHLCDYREFNPGCQYDAIVSVGMFEHVNSNNYREFMQIVNKLLKPGGLFLLHSIGSNKTKILEDRWLTKYIFPNSCLPSLAQITQSCEEIFVVEDVHNFGPHYDRTLMCWYDNFKNNFEKINSQRETPLSTEFYRMWTYYLLSCAATFRCRRAQLFQVVLSKKSSALYQRPDF